MAGKREEIVAAAAKVFRRKGYHQSTTEDIANEVGMLKGSLYYYIERKEDLLYAVVEPPLRSMMLDLQRIVAMPRPAAEKIERLIASHVETFDAHYPHIFVYFQELAQGTITQPGDSAGAEFAKLGEQYRHLVVQIIAEGVRQGEFRADLDPELAAFALLGMCNWMYKWYQPSGRFNSQEIARRFISIILHGFLASN